MKPVKAKDETVGTGKPTMDFYIGSKEILARSMNRLEYNIYRGWELPSDENGEDSGFLVEYLNSGESNDDRHKGYISWSPSKVFIGAYKENGNLTFGGAIKALKQGKRVSRKGWNGKGLFVFMQVPSNVPKDIVPKMSSLPQTVKDELWFRFINKEEIGLKDTDLKYRNQLCIVYPDNTISSWNPSSSDCLEEDWIILD